MLISVDRTAVLSPLASFNTATLDYGYHIRPSSIEGKVSVKARYYWCIARKLWRFGVSSSLKGDVLALQG